MYIILVSDVQHGDSVILLFKDHISLKNYSKIMDIIPWAIQYILGAYVLYTYTS